MKILDGKKLSEEKIISLKQDFLKFQEATLAIIQVGDNPASNIYIDRKIKMAEKLGATAEVFKFEESATEDEVLEKISTLNIDSKINGIIIQLPLPADFNFNKLISEIVPEKDVDGLGEHNIYHLVINQEKILPATTRGIITLLEENQIEISGQKVVVLGRSLLVGKSLALALINRNATVTVCHSKTKNLSEVCSKADILISAVGKPGLIKPEFTNPNQIVIDVGITIENGKMLGDAQPDLGQGVSKIAGKSPVPGGVGPMTVISLFQNLADACKMQNRD